MSILAKNNSNNKSTNTVSITTNKMTAKFFKQLLLKSLGRREQALDLINCFAESLKNNTIVSPYKSCAELLKDYGLNPKETRFNESFTILKKLGIVLKHNNHYLLNPLVEEKATARSYELAVEYYNLLFKDIAFDTFEFKTLADLENQAACCFIKELAEQNERIDLNNYAFNKGMAGYAYIEPLEIKSPEDYTAIFNSPKKSLDGSTKRIWNAISDSYRNICSDYITQMLMKHVEMLKEQGVVEVNWGKWNRPIYTFNRITLISQKTLIPLTATKTYQDSIPPSDAQLTAELFETTKQELQQQFEEEDLNQEFEIEKQQQEFLDLDTERKVAEIMAAHNSNKPKEVINPYPTLTDPDEINAVVAKIRQEGRFPTQADCLPLNIDIQLCTEAHNAWCVQQKPIWDGIARAKQLELAQKIAH